MYVADKELPWIMEEADWRGIDYCFLVAIRRAENGDAGREFGVLSEAAPSYIDQLRITGASVLHSLARFPGNPLRMSGGRLAYSDAFIKTFAQRWAPLGVANDPDGLNANWVRDVTNLYNEEIARELKEARADD